MLQPNPTIPELLNSPETFATTLVAVLVHEYGTEALAWHPSTVRLQLASDYGVQIPDLNFEKLMAGMATLATDGFYDNLPRFNVLCLALCGSGAPDEMMETADSAEIAWAVTEAMLLDPPESEDPFSEEIKAFVAKVLSSEGFTRPPDALRMLVGDADLVGIQAMDYSEDPEFFASLYATQQEKTAAVDAMVAQNLKELFGQLKSAPLFGANTADLLARLPEHIRIPVHSNPEPQ